jgi:eukaryotic-like serine/threonine-protein kinase
MVIGYRVQNRSFDGGKPRLWSDQRLQNVGGPLNYDLAPDGQRFAILRGLNPTTEEKGAVQIAFLLNFFDELRRRAPVGK